ncbi:hypothetical protein E308F_05980 [Moorella sp. E308F]|uniref:peptidase MA family metallohydrolase n=1 Tax=unclassified Neomoorella TaxID=2676739 RepID=UPI0010FFBC27|nr:MULTISPECIES: hypothetical protein [unclassified Moorella (in: firmicutes)]GEA14356.1 hypothetical protein E308F_05980 [Moorella sp. E308F]GEA18272.1 hypothetical protein E306M_14080 [Moorella sp. E306M]
MLQHWWQVIIVSCLAVLAVAVVILARTTALPRTLSYSLVRQIVAAHTAWQTRNWQEIDSSHFRLRYRQEDAAIAPLVLATAEEAYGPVGAMLQHAPHGKTLIILYPDRESLARQFGWAASESAMGVYWGGVIRVLSPFDWVAGRDLKEIAHIFAVSGPVAHELTHLMVDEKARGNYPRWLTEGIAQYIEKELTGFTMPGSPDATGWYPLKAMDYGFDSLPDQALAYRQSFLMVAYLVEKWGLPALRQVLERLGRGAPLERAFQEVLGVSTVTFEEAFSREFPVSRFSQSL